MEIVAQLTFDVAKTVTETQTIKVESFLQYVQNLPVQNREELEYFLREYIDDQIEYPEDVIDYSTDYNTINLEEALNYVESKITYVTGESIDPENIIATITYASVNLYENVFNSREEKCQFLKSSLEEQRDFLLQRASTPKLRSVQIY